MKLNSYISMLHTIPHRPNLHLLAYFLLALCLGMSAQLQANSSQQESEKKLAKVQSKIQKSQQKIEKKRGKIGKLEKQLRESEKHIGQLDQQLSVTKAELQNSNKKIQALENQKNDLQNKLSKHRTALNIQIKSEYLFDGQEKLKLLLNKQKPTELGRTLVYYDYLYQARMNEIEDATKILEDLEEVQINIEQEQSLVRNTQISLLQEKNLLQKEQQKRNDVLRDLENNVSSEKAKLAELKENEKQLKELLEQLQATLANLPVHEQGQGFHEFKGSLYWPVVGKPSNKFGQKRNAARSNLNWEGVYIPSNEGNNVRSIYHGRIAFAEWMRGLGLLIIVDHGSGYMSLYGHNQSLYKSVGEWVNAGDRLATVGNSGGKVHAGLYFEIRKNGKPVNPAIWCTKQASARRSAG